jgi:hypothetical protein
LVAVIYQLFCGPRAQNNFGVFFRRHPGAQKFVPEKKSGPALPDFPVWLNDPFQQLMFNLCQYRDIIV